MSLLTSSAGVSNLLSAFAKPIGFGKRRKNLTRSAWIKRPFPSRSNSDHTSTSSFSSAGVKIIPSDSTFRDENESRTENVMRLSIINAIRTTKEYLVEKATETFVVTMSK